MKYMSVGFNEVDAVHWPMIMRNNFSNLKRMGHIIEKVQCHLDTAEEWMGANLPAYLRSEANRLLDTVGSAPFTTWDGVEFEINNDIIVKNTFVVFLK